MWNGLAVTSPFRLVPFNIKLLYRKTRVPTINRMQECNILIDSSRYFTPSKNWKNETMKHPHTSLSTFVIYYADVSGACLHPVWAKQHRVRKSKATTFVDGYKVFCIFYPFVTEKWSLYLTWLTGLLAYRYFKRDSRLYWRTLWSRVLVEIMLTDFPYRGSQRTVASDT